MPGDPTVYIWWLVNRDGPTEMGWRTPMRDWLRPASETRELVQDAIKEATRWTHATDPSTR